MDAHDVRLVAWHCARATRLHVNDAGVNNSADDNDVGCIDAAFVERVLARVAAAMSSTSNASLAMALSAKPSQQSLATLVALALAGAPSTYELHGALARLKNLQ